MGLESTREVTMDHMCDNVAAVRRGAPGTHVIGDMPFRSDDTPEIALQNARRFLSAGADSVKLEGPKYNVIEALRSERIEVVGHTGLTPQTAANFKQVGRQPEEARRVLQEAQGLARAGCFLVVLEHIPSDLGREITKAIPVPTVGIGAGSDCDGQVLVINDVIGLGDRWPPFSRQYMHLTRLLEEATGQYVKEVKERSFP
jgi:3-methyl-2-oxobutanoate hydroxymethyltransferase